MLRVKMYALKLICKLFGHKPMKGYDLEYPVLFDPPIGRKYCERCGELLDEVG